MSSFECVCESDVFVYFKKAIMVLFYCKNGFKFLFVFKIGFWGRHNKGCDWSVLKQSIFACC